MPLVSFSGPLSRRALFALAACSFVACALFAGSEVRAQTPQPTIFCAIRSDGDSLVTLGRIWLRESCVRYNARALLESTPAGTLAYFKAISSIPALQNAAPGSLLGLAIDNAGDCYVTAMGTIVPTPGAYQSDKTSGMYVVELDPQASKRGVRHVSGRQRP